MIVTKKALPRRTVLRGMGAALALPFLDSMVPAFAATGESAATAVPRLCAIYLPNGCQMVNWTPIGEGTALELSPILQPLKPFRDQITVISGLANTEADAYPGEGAGDHSRGPAAWLSGVHARKTDGADLQAGTTMDQIAAQQLGKLTQLASLELSLESTEMLGACDVGYSCAYQGTISWRSSTTPLSMENDPRAVFERLFGTDSTDPRVRLEWIRRERSVLDSVAEQVTGLRRVLGTQDLGKLGEYLDAVRDVERRIQRTEEQNSRELPVVEQPVGIPPTFEQHAKLMFDLQVLAYQCDLTRVITFMMGREVSNRTYPEIGVPDPHHPTSHHQNDPAKMEKVTKINTYQAQMFAYFLEKLRTTPAGDGSLLDQMIIVYGAGISDADLHNHINLPMLIAGGAARRLKGGRHIKFAEAVPLTNLHLTVLDMLGIPLDRLGDSTGTLDALSI
jgi:hypothetical protein